MIDFRYHLVSLVGVFLALAIGVVLGAGPLRDSIGDTLSSQVDLLREDRAQLQGQVDDLSGQLAARDAALAAVAPAVAEGVLDGTTTVVVALPGADGELVEDLSDGVADAGGAVSGVVDLRDAWSDPEASEARDEVAAALPERALGEVTTEDAGTPALLSAALAGAVVAPDPVLAGTASVAGREVLDALAAADLVQLEGDPVLRAATALVVAPAPAQQPADGDAAPGASAELALLQALEATGAGVVLAGPAEAAAEGGAVAVLRGDDLAGLVTGVDGAGSAAGELAVVLALREQLDGGAGQYGAGDGAGAALPPLAAARAAAAEQPGGEG
ncbi:copper transporter [Pseudokineococcus sp. 5B2Z-1]|uniref:copper transporter n=1 Tax=Pseudokineococcus sp. 5B2Z-1 TaxID=3132744 RepID=UPI0030B701F8